MGGIPHLQETYMGGGGEDPISSGNLDGRDPIPPGIRGWGEPISARNLDGEWGSHICRKSRWGYAISAGNLYGRSHTCRKPR